MDSNSIKFDNKIISLDTTKDNLIKITNKIEWHNDTMMSYSIVSKEELKGLAEFILNYLENK